MSQSAKTVHDPFQAVRKNRPCPRFVGGNPSGLSLRIAITWKCLAIFILLELLGLLSLGTDRAQRVVMAQAGPVVDGQWRHITAAVSRHEVDARMLFMDGDIASQFDATTVADDGSNSEFTITLKTPQSVPVTAVTLAAEGSLLIGPASTIERAGPGKSIVANLGTLGISVGPQTTLGDVWSTSVVLLGPRAHVRGKVRAPLVIQGEEVLIDEGIDETSALTPPTVTSWTVRFEGAGSHVNVATGQSTADPGRYGTIRVASKTTLTLKTGAYFIDALHLKAQSRLVLNQDAGPVLLYIRDSIQLCGEIVSARGTPPDVLVAYLGTGTVTLNVPFNGMIVAPNALLNLSSIPGGHVGAFFAKDILVASGTKVTFRAPHAIISAASTPPEPPPPAEGGWKCFLSEAASLQITPADQGSPQSSTTLAGNLNFEFEDGRLTLQSWQGTSGPATLGTVFSRLEINNDPTLQLTGSLSATGAVNFEGALTFSPRDADGAGNIVVGWEGPDSPRVGFAVFVKGFAADGSVVFQKQRVDLAPQDEHTLIGCPAVARARGGDFAVAWASSQPVTQGSEDRIKARLFASDGSPRGTDEVVVSNPTALIGVDRSCPAVGMDAQGRVVVAWNEFRPQQNTTRLVARRLRSDGAFDGPEFEVTENQLALVQQLPPQVAVEPKGGFVVS